MAHSSVSRPLEQSAAADPSETLAVGWRDADQWELRRSCVCGCECGCGCAANSAPLRLRSCSHGWSQSWFQCVCRRLSHGEQMRMETTPQPMRLPSKPCSVFVCVSGYNFMLHFWILLKCFTVHAGSKSTSMMEIRTISHCSRAEESLKGHVANPFAWYCHFYYLYSCQTDGQMSYYRGKNTTCEYYVSSMLYWAPKTPIWLQWYCAILWCKNKSSFFVQIYLVCWGLIKYTLL